VQYALLLSSGAAASKAREAVTTKLVAMSFQARQRLRLHNELQGMQMPPHMPPPSPVVFPL
jgi:hypothetical protein